MPASPSQFASLEVKLGHNPLAFFYRLFTPTLTINGLKESRPWGIHVFTVPPGEYEVAASYPWLMSECGRNSVRFTLAAGERKRVTYGARLIRFIPGAIKVETIPT